MRLSTRALVTWSAANTATVMTAMRIREIILTRGVIAEGVSILDFRFWIFDS